MHLNGPNRFPAQLKSIKIGSAVAQIIVQVGESEIESLLTRQDAEKLHLGPGDSVIVAIKPTDVVLQRSRPIVSAPSTANAAAHHALK